MSFIVAIDGPAGTGKGTIAKNISQELGYINIDTGAMYRSITLELLEKGINNIKDKEEIIKIANNINIDLTEENEVYLNGKNVTKEIRTEKVNSFVSEVSSIPEVRNIMIKLQRKMAENKNVVMEGRDITTVVFPNADVKIFLDADVEERAKRRYNEMNEKGIAITFEEVLDSIKLRDFKDKNKPVGALKIADDAIIIDTTNLSIKQVTEEIINIILDKIGKERK